MNETSIIATPFGNLKLYASSDALLSCHWSRAKINNGASSPVLRESIKQLNAYFQKKLHIFDLPLEPKGTNFQQRVWDALQTIPYGETCSYLDIARHIKQPKSSRAVGAANGKNPLCVIIPCHRVIYASGRLGGYSAGLGYKEKLLEMEKNV